MKSTLLRTSVLVVTVLFLAVPAAAQNRTAPGAPNGWHEQCSEFGCGQALYQDAIDGEARPFEAKFWTNTLYNSHYGPDRRVTYFMFGLDTQRTPLTGSFDALIDGSTGHSIPIYRVEEEQGGKLVKWIVDAVNMPPPGTPIVLRGTIGSTGTGQYQAGALLQPFNYKWEPVMTSTGTPASLYIFTQYGVHRPTGEGCTGALCGPLNVIRETPLLPAAGVLTIVVAGAVLAVRRFR